MNVQGAGRRAPLGRSIMSRFHAGFSLGTVAGALVGAAMVALDVPVTAHLLVVGVAVAVGVPLVARGFIADRHDAEPGRRRGSARARRSPPGASAARC